MQEADGTPSRLTPVMVRHHSGQTDASGQLEVCLWQRFPNEPLLIRALEPKRDGLIMQPGAQQEHTVRLLPRPTLRGRVTQTGGPPVRGFHLELKSAQVSPPISHDFAGDQFELREVAIGHGQLLVNLDDGRRALVPIDTSSGEDSFLEVPVHSSVALTGRIVDATTGAPLADVEVAIYLFANTRTGRDGRFTLGNLPTGDHQLQINGLPKHTFREQPVTLKPSQDLALGDIALPLK